MDPIIASFLQFVTDNSNISPQDSDLLLPYIKAHKAKKKDLIFSGNTYCKHLYFIQKGLLRLYHINDGSIATVGFLQESDFFHDFESSIGSCHSNIYVECIEPSEYITIPYDRLLEAYDKSHALERFGRLMAERAFMEYVSMVSLAKQPQPIDRYESFEKEKPDLVNRIPLNILASFIGITPESLSRIRKRRVSNA